MSLTHATATTAPASVTASRKDCTHQRLTVSAVVALIVLLLASCATTPTVAPRTPAMPVSVQCDPACTEACADTLPRWTGDPAAPRTWDALGDVVAGLIEVIATCDAARRACVQCLHRLDAVGATCGTAVPCAKERAE